MTHFAMIFLFANLCPRTCLHFVFRVSAPVGLAHCLPDCPQAAAQTSSRSRRRGGRGRPHDDDASEEDEYLIKQAWHR
ncbi:hypothetical protein EVAR_100605_1 [Eumeta japonica]|uniref:Secreted protein n=1 Tax=Eumeta variegata TaxID=151549 RepID=A0A4C2AAT4_EUMVA|nr:hypothetical protein EVAR_100605_1 [Eumeta japonica]